MEHTDINESQYHILESHSPVCDEDLKPLLGRSFNSLDGAIDFYKVYAETCGFDTRRGTASRCRDGSIIRMYMYCNRQGEKNVVHDDANNENTKVKRRRVSNRVGCMARVAFKFFAGKGFVVDLFEEKHNHQLVADEFKKYLKVNRKLGYVHHNFIMNCAKANIGATKSYRFFKEVVGDYTAVGAMKNDWKNFAHDMKAYIDGCDAQIMLHKMALKKENCSAFYFDYTVDKNDNLTCVFWADPIARRNYSAFGDVVSFDCTYSTNRYNMIFAPFTGKDNHGKIVTFGAALLSGEDNKMYSWVFEQFKVCMGSSPRLIITDQDPAMKVALERVLPNSIHRLCMWHIMMKVPEKTPLHLKKNDSFRKRLNDTVWSDMIVTSVFEQQWKDIMVDFDLVDNSWFRALYDIRQFWIPAYFREIPLSGICRTTSISESVNSFFSNYLCKGSNLVEFIMHFDSALDSQRQSNDILNSSDSSSVSLLKTPLQVEQHAAAIYTNSQFIKVQEEIVAACFCCSLVSTKQIDEGNIYVVDDGFDDSLTVTYKKDGDDIVCSCNKFLRDGLLCCHIFLIFRHLKWIRIPEKYIVPRWTKAALSHCGGLGELVSCVNLDDNKRMVNKLISLFYECVGAVEGHKERMTTLMGGLLDLKAVLNSGEAECSSSVAKSRMFDMFYGCNKPAEVNVNPPLPVKTKGSGSRLKSRREAAIEHAKKPLRMCSKCKTLSDHDARNCKS